MALIIYTIFIALLFFFMVLMLLEMVEDLFFKKVPYVRSENRVIANALEEIRPVKGQVVYDLGSGDGKFLRGLTKKYPDIKAVGFEKSLLPFLISQMRLNKKYKIKFKNFYKQDFSQPDYIYAYLFPEYMKDLEEKVKKELKPGALFISSTFPFPGWEPIKIVPLSGSKTKNWGKLFIYQK